MSPRGSGKNRRTLESISYYPTPTELYNELMKAKGWHYKTNKEHYLARDRALVALLYLGAFRISEALRLKKNQFENRGNHIYVKAVQLSKRKPGKIAYRDARLPLRGKREELTHLVLAYLNLLEEPDARLFPWSLNVKRYKSGTYKTKAKEGQKPETKTRWSVQMSGTKRAWQVVNALVPQYTQHWLRAFGEDYLYDAWDHDLLAVADAVKADPRTIQGYLRKRQEKYPPV